MTGIMKRPGKPTRLNATGHTDDSINGLQPPLGVLMLGNIILKEIQILIFQETDNRLTIEIG